MKQIVFETVKINANKVEIPFSATDPIKKYFSDFVFKAEYFIGGNEFDLTGVPEGIAVIPLLCNILPAAWMTDSEIVLSELDRDFYNAVDKFKQGYIDMYPDAQFKGRLTVKNISEYPKDTSTQRSAAFFSAGVDAYCTLARHMDEHPDLITVWGADIPCDDREGWNIKYNKIKTEAERLGLSSIAIRSNFRKVINENTLSLDFGSQLHDNWWHGAQHGIGLIGHAAPFAFIRKTRTLYIAATCCKEYHNTCASDPTIDNFVRFHVTQTVHDAFISRQEKIKIIVAAHKNGIPVNLHVCWKTATGNNCCHCEKCNRTIMGLFAEGEWPGDYGFPNDEDTYKRSGRLCKNVIEYDDILKPYWTQIQQRAIENSDVIKNKGYFKYISPICSLDFVEINNSVGRRIRRLCIRAVGAVRKIKRVIKERHQ